MDESIEIEYYETETGKCPYLEWEHGLTVELRAQVRKRLNRVRLGNIGDINRIDGNIFELRIHTGAGYRIYCCKKNGKLIVLLCAGSKRSQNRDIEKAKKYLLDLGV